MSVVIFKEDDLIPETPAPGMVQKAAMAFIGRSGDTPPELQGFLNFRAGLERRQLKGDEAIAVLRIGDTDSHHVLFLDKGTRLGAIETELAGIEAELDPKARIQLKKALKRVNDG
jgi:hypothetical protein